MAYGIVHKFAGGTKEQYEASVAAVHPEVVNAMLPGLSDIAAALGLPATSELRMPTITVR